MIFAAGFGKRMLPLSQHCPKPLLKVAAKPLIEYHLEKLAACGVKEVVINVSYLGDQIIQALGDGAKWGLNIRYSIEAQPLETYGGLMNAFDLLVEDNTQPFLLINGDVYCDVGFSAFIAQAEAVLSDKVLAYLLMAPNPEHNFHGDFSLVNEQGLLKELEGDNHSTFTGVSILLPQLLSRYPAKQGKLSEVFRAAMQDDALFGVLHGGVWRDIGTPERLHELDKELSGDH